MSKSTVREFIDSLGELRSIHELLFNITSNKDSFKMIYDELTNDELIDFNKINNEYIIESYLKVFSQYDDETFNKYFFHSLYKSDLLEISKLREEYFKRPHNEKFRSYVNSIDNPKRIDEIIEKIKDYYSYSKEDALEYAKQELEKIIKLNTNNAKGSRAISSLYIFLNDVNNKEGTKELFKVIKDLKIDLIKIEKNIDMGGLSFKSLKGDLFTELKEEIESQSKYSPYEFISKITSFRNIYSIINESNIKNEDLLYLWPSFIEETIKEFNKRREFLEKPNDFNSNEKVYSNDKELIFDLLENKGIRYKLFKIYKNEDEIKDFIRVLDKIDLDYSLSPAKKEESKPFKI